MKHDYTDDELLEAFEKSEPLKLGVYKGLRAFLDALPERPQAQPSPWPGQQEAIDAAFQQIDEFYLDYKSSHDDWEHEAPARLAIAQAYDAARPQAAEIASLKATLLQAQEAAKDLLNQRDKAQAELAALRKPIQSDAGISLGQVLYEAGAAVANNTPGQPPCDPWSESEDCHEAAEAAAQAVVAAARPAIEAECLAQAVRRMGAVPWRELKYVNYEAVRARLIAAAKGEGQPVVVNEPLQAEEPAQPWTPAVGDTVRLKSGGPVMTVIAVGVQVTCFYYTEQGVLKRGVIPAACLTPANP